MTPEICLISVPHNGTGFAIQMFVKNGWQEQPLNGRPMREPVLYQGHCESASQWRMALALSERMPLIMPLRHPYRVEESWRRRGEDHDRMMRAYAVMLSILVPHVSVWVPLDAGVDERVRARLNLAKMAGKALDIDWDTPINSVHSTHAVPLSELDPSPRIRNIRKHSLFRRIYGDGDGQAHVRGTPHAEQQAE